MKKDRRTLIAVAAALLVLVTLNGFVFQKEHLRKTGTTMFLELDVRDPRSLLQGDYMALRYVVPEAIAADTTLAPEGRFVVRLDARGVAALRRVHRPGERLGKGEHLLRYRRRGDAILLGPSAFFFQEGRGPEYASARFGEFRVDADGDALLVGLRDADLNPLGP
ncbi:GDYXXLXY domain-containing protein [Rhodocaloribacter sp.]